MVARWLSAKEVDQHRWVKQDMTYVGITGKWLPRHLAGWLQGLQARQVGIWMERCGAVQEA